MQDREERLTRLAAEALQTPAAQREIFLRAACQQDQELYSEVTEMVEWEERMGGFLRDPLVGLIDMEALDRPFKPGQVISQRFEVLREVGQGGMGVVYEAYDRKRGQRIAIKCAKMGFERLPPELNGALKVRHPNVCLVNEIHVASTALGKLDFLTMEFLDGETLLERLGRGKIAPGEALDLARQLCSGLAEAHRCGVLHCDLKPANVILCTTQDKKTRAVITDFGLAVDQNGNTDVVGGTARYMAPELKPKGKSTPASDVYALGVILYEMVTGRKPFPSDAGKSGILPAPPAPSKVVSALPRIWDHALLPCLRFHPARRPSAADVLDVLDRKPVYRRPLPAVAAAALIVAVTLAWKPVQEYFRPPDVSLAILPAKTTGTAPQTGEHVLHDLVERLAQEPGDKPKFVVIPPSRAAKKGVATPEQAEKILHATHVLQLELRREGDIVSVKASLVNAKTQAHLRDYAGYFPEDDLNQATTGLTGTVTSALHLAHLTPLMPISSEAVAAYTAGRNYLREGRYSFDKAIAQFQKAAQQDPRSPLPFAGLAEAYAAKYRVREDPKALDEAAVHLQTAEKLDPDSPTVRVTAAWLNIFQNRNAQASEDCARALEVDPKNAQAWMLCGYLYDIEGIDGKALDYFNKAIALDPTYFRPYQFLGGYYYDRAQYAEAEAQYRKEVKYALNDMDGLSDLGGVLVEEGKYSEAEEILREALRIRVTPASLDNLGAAMAYRGRDTEALRYYQRAAAMEASNHRYWINIGDVQRRLKLPGAGRAAYRKAFALTSDHLKRSPGSYQIRAYMAYTEARLGQKANARSGIVQALQSPDKDKQLLMCAIWTYEALGDREQTLKLVSQITPEMKIAIEHHPDLADLRRDSRY
jgi:eukaryotic-like serine/threonine-protein kinase